MSLTREAELAALIAEQEEDARHGDRIMDSGWSRRVSMDAPLSDDHEAGTLADILGEDDQQLATLLGENEQTEVRLVRDSRVTPKDVASWRWARTRRKWTYRKIAEHFGVNEKVVYYHLRKPARRTSAQRENLEAKLDVAKVVYEQGARLIDIAGELYEEAGYASAESCYQQLRLLFYERGVAVRPRSWKHGKRSKDATPEEYEAYWREQNRKQAEHRRLTLVKCEATTNEGKRCSRWARRTTPLCNVHAGLTGGPKKWTVDVVLASLRAWRDENGRWPQAREWSRATAEHPSFRTVYNLFASWPEAIEAASYEQAAA